MAGFYISISITSFFLFSINELLLIGFCSIFLNVSLIVLDCPADRPNSISLLILLIYFFFFYFLKSKAALSKTAKYVQLNLIRYNGIPNLTNSIFLFYSLWIGEFIVLSSLSSVTPYTSFKYNLFN